MKPEQNKIHVGLKFTAMHSSCSYEVKSVGWDRAEVIVIDSQGHGRLEEFSVPHMAAMFAKGEYIPVDPKEVNISII